MKKRQKPGCSKIHLHIGAHKTATSHLQKLLLINREHLLSRGVHYDGPEQLRGEWLTGFRAFSGASLKGLRVIGRRRLQAVQPGQPLWLISEENLIGVPKDLTRQGGLYPMAGKRLAAFRHLFPAPELKIFLALRSYDSFFRSCYCEIVRNNGYFSWDRFLHESTLKMNSWVGVMDQLTAFLPEENLSFWCYEDHGLLESTLLQSLTDLQMGESNSPHETDTLTRTSLTAKALAELSRRPPPESHNEHRKLVHSLMKQYPVSEGYEPFDPWKTHEKERLQERYRLDLERICDRYPAAQFLTPPGSTLP